MSVYQELERLWAQASPSREGAGTRRLKQPRNGRTNADHSILNQEANGISLEYRRSRVVRAYPDGGIEINNGGWSTFSSRLHGNGFGAQAARRFVRNFVPWPINAFVYLGSDILVTEDADGWRFTNKEWADFDKEDLTPTREAGKRVRAAFPEEYAIYKAHKEKRVDGAGLPGGGYNWYSRAVYRMAKTHDLWNRKVTLYEPPLTMKDRNGVERKGYRYGT